MLESEGSVQLDPNEALLLEAYGMPLLAYLCAVEETAMRARLRAEGNLSAGAEKVLATELFPFAQQIAARLAADPGMPRSILLDVLVASATEDAIGIGTALHRASGGTAPDEIPAPPPGDEVKLALAQMAVDSYPLLLAPRDNGWTMPRVSLFRHFKRSALQAAVQSDPALSRLFTHDDSGLGRRGHFYTSLGRGGSVQDVMFGEMVIGSAWDAIEKSAPVPTLAGLVEMVYLNIDILRRATVGGDSTVRALVVFTGFTTHDGQSIATPWGTLRRLRDWERKLAPPSLEGAVSGANPDGSQVLVSYAGEMVLEVQVPYAVLIDRNPKPVDAQFKWPTIAGADSLRRIVESVQLAVLLATERPVGSWVTAKSAWTWICDPFGHGPHMSWFDVRSSSAFMPTELSSEECKAVGQWADRVASHWIPRVDIAVRRFIGAASVRTDQADRLVDAVIVWENLFGTSQGEPRLRISSAMAWLLKDDAVEREEFQIKLKDIYDFRSKIVHGGKFDESSVAEQANDALKYARDALRALLRDRPDVLKLADGAARSLRMIMGG